MIPLKRSLDEASLIIWLSTSAIKTKIRGESGSPFLRPLVDLMWPPEEPLIEMDEILVLSIASIHPHHFVGKPLCFIKSKMKSQCTVSKALEKSNFRRVPGVDVLWQ